MLCSALYFWIKCSFLFFPLFIIPSPTVLTKANITHTLFSLLQHSLEVDMKLSLEQGGGRDLLKVILDGGKFWRKDKNGNTAGVSNLVEPSWLCRRSLWIHKSIAVKACCWKWLIACYVVWSHSPFMYCFLLVSQLPKVSVNCFVRQKDLKFQRHIVIQIKEWLH